MTKKDTYDYIVVGLGSAGSAVAGGLAARGHRVLALEAGGTDLVPQVLVPAGMMKMPKKNYWPFTVEPDPTRLGKQDLWAAGRLLGGGSSVNAMLWVRGHRDDFDEWAKLGAVGWDYESLLPLMRTIERFDGMGSPLRGTKGPQHVSRVRLRHPVVERFIRSAVEAGHPFNEDYNSDELEGVAWSQLSQRNGLRQSSARAFLHPAARRHRNLTVVTGAEVDRVVVEDGRAVAVDYVRGRDQRRAFAAKEVVLSSGAINTPAILLRSGIGEASALRFLGIDMTAEVPGVGQNLQEHTTVRLQYQVDERTLNQELTPAGMLRGAVQMALHRSGPATAPLANAVLFGRVGGRSEGRPDYQVMFAPLSLAVRPDGSSSKQSVKLAKNSVVSALVALLHPRVRGTVSITSPELHELPRIDLHYLDDKQDVADLIEACRDIRDVFGAPAMRQSVTVEDYPGAEVQTDEQWLQFLRERSQNCAHWVGTARMGSLDDPMVVVDPQLRVRGIEGLRVADASVMPTIPSGNTNAQSILIGVRAAELLNGRS